MLLKKQGSRAGVQGSRVLGSKGSRKGQVQKKMEMKVYGCRDSFLAVFLEWVYSNP
jgi:hypothetical protein